MGSGATEAAVSDSTASVLATLVAVDGSAAQAFPRSKALLSGPDAARNLADTVHYLCVLHGRLPGVVDLAAEREGDGSASAWLAQADEGFAQERLRLTQLAVAAGPVPSTPGQSECEATVLGQRHALEMLARSDRAGCALGAALALILDWHGVRGVLDVAAERFGVALRPVTIPDEAATLAALAQIEPARHRAILFGAQQILAQHRGLWSLLEARQMARRGG